MTYLFLFVISFLIRIVKLDQSLWLDEGSTIQFASMSLDNLFSSLKGDFHPPLYYLLIRQLFVFFGTNLLYARLVSVFFGSLTVVFFASLLKKMFMNTRLGLEKFSLPLYLAGGLLLAFNPLHVYYSQEIRSYSLATFLAVLSWWLLLKRTNLSLFTWFIVQVISVFTFYGLVFNLISSLVFLFFDNKKLFLKATWYSFLVFFIFLFWLPIFFVQLKGGGYLTTALPGWRELSGIAGLKSLTLLMTKTHLGHISLNPKSLYSFIVILIICYQSFLFFLSIRRPALPFWFWFFIPLMLGMLISLKSPMMGYWRFLFIVPAVIGLISYGLQLLPGNLGLVNFSISIIFYLVCLFTYWQNPNFQREDWRGLTKEVGGQKLLISFSGPFAPLEYYLKKDQVIPLQSTVGHNRTDWNKFLTNQIKSETLLYYTDYLTSLTDPQMEILTWLNDKGYVLVRQKSFMGLGNLYQFQKL